MYPELVQMTLCLSLHVPQRFSDFLVQGLKKAEAQLPDPSWIDFRQAESIGDKPARQVKN